MENFGVPVMPETILTNYETGIFPAVRKVFFCRRTQWSLLPLLAMHLPKNSRFGLSQPYSKDPQIQGIARRLVSYPFSLPNEMLRAFNNYCNDVEPTFEQQPTLKTFFAYLEIFWIWGANASRFLECIWPSRSVANDQQVRKLEPGLEQIRGNSVSSFLECVEKTDRTRTGFSFGYEENFRWRAAPEEEIEV